MRGAQLLRLALMGEAARELASSLNSGEHGCIGRSREGAWSRCQEETSSLAFYTEGAGVPGGRHRAPPGRGARGVGRGSKGT